MLMDWSECEAEGRGERLGHLYWLSDGRGVALLVGIVSGCVFGRKEL
jgi:hypothetical protein